MGTRGPGAEPGIGVVGLGIIGSQHVERLADPAIPARLVGVHDADGAVTVDFARAHGVPGCTNLQDLLAQDGLDAVIIAVPSGLHRDLTIAALEAGKHVLLEKPIEVNVAAADEILRASRKAGTVLSVASQRRFADANGFIKRLLEAGGLGRVTSATVEVPLWRTQAYYDSAGWRGTWAMDGGGALMNQGVHLVDLALWLLGDVEELYAHTGQLAHERIEVEDTVTITARLRSGALLTFLATTAAHAPPPIRMAIMGDRGSVVTLDEQITHFATVDGPQDVEFAPREGEEARHSEVEHQQRLQLLDFLAALRGEKPPLVTAEQARNALAFIEAVYESGRTGRPVRPAAADPLA